LCAPTFVNAVTEVLGPVNSIADIGCGGGGYSAEFKRRGLEVYAGEYSWLGRTIAKCQGVTARPFDVSDPTTALLRTFDLAFSIEVAEHIPPALADAFVAYMCSAAPTLVVTAARPGQGGQGHINEQDQAYWIGKFDARGFQFDPDASRRLAEKLRAPKIPRFLSENAMVFRGIPTPAWTATGRKNA